MLGGKGGSMPTEANRRPTDAKMYLLPDFITTAEVDNINLFELVARNKKNKITHKLHTFGEIYVPVVTVHKPQSQTGGIKQFLKNITEKKTNFDSENTEVSETPTITTQEHGRNPILQVLSFLESLTNSSEDGRVVCTRLPTLGASSLKFLLLNPAVHFSEIVREARSVIVAGGTMQPINEFKNQLFISAGGDDTRIEIFSCDHVIDPSHILPIIVTHGPSSRALDFSYKTRTSNDILKELGMILKNVCNVIPAGVVCFFPSYEYEKLVIAHLEKTKVLEKLELKKKIFREPKKSCEVDTVLANYSKAIDETKKKSGSCTGALLFSVIGGKLSEGLNFSDDLGRCVIVVGMPYPNITSPELKEKMQFLDLTCGEGSGRQYYENLCMKAVNQSIGRAVRHKNDYSTVLLLDQRYARNSTQADLPGWIKKSLVTENKFGNVMSRLAKFFSTKPKTDV